jgi:hypothetical protein
MQSSIGLYGARRPACLDCFVALLLAMTRYDAFVIASEAKQSMAGCERGEIFMPQQYWNPACYSGSGKA